MKSPNQPSVIRLILADDHVLVRAGIRALLEQISGVTVLAEASDGAEALALCQKLNPEVVVTDVGMRGGGGLVLLEQLRATQPQVRVVILSMHANAEYVQRALRVGAAGYVLKDAATNELESALFTAARGEVYLSPTLSRAMMDSYIGRTPQDPLTPRQRETLKLIAEGRTNKEIAAELGVSTKTVETHRMQLRERLGIHDTAGLVKYAQRTGIIPPEG